MCRGWGAGETEAGLTDATRPPTRRLVPPMSPNGPMPTHGSRSAVRNTADDVQLGALTGTRRSVSTTIPLHFRAVHVTGHRVPYVRIGRMSGPKDGGTNRWGSGQPWQLQTRQLLILAPGGSRGHSKDWTVTLENGPSPSALRGAVATVGGGLASAFKPRLRLRSIFPDIVTLITMIEYHLQNRGPMKNTKGPSPNKTQGSA